ncbi:HicA-like toxin [Gordonia phage Ligma]|nr:HicA-like toxin [Gordonia phage Ligma]UQT02171.1 hypothetical protein SEA_AXUMITE_72 [Gordonia phage Axumite]
MKREVKDLVTRVEVAGGEVRRSKRNSHLKVYLDGRLIGVIPSTPSDHRALKNSISQLRRNGLAI